MVKHWARDPGATRLCQASKTQITSTKLAKPSPLDGDTSFGTLATVNPNRPSLAGRQGRLVHRDTAGIRSSRDLLLGVLI